MPVLLSCRSGVLPHWYPTPLVRVQARNVEHDGDPFHEAIVINADVSLYLGRLPGGEWIGLEATGHVSAEGVSVGSCDLYDERGRIGWSTFAPVAKPAPVDVGG